MSEDIFFFFASFSSFNLPLITPSNMTTVTEAVNQRISTRSFLPTPPDPLVIAKAIQTASRAPSGGNTQPWHAYALFGDKVNDLVENTLNGDGVILEDSGEFKMYPDDKEMLRRRRELAFAMYGLMGVGRKDKEARIKAMLRNYKFFDAPVAIIITVDRMVDRNGWGHVGMFIMTLCLLLQEAGLGTCLQESWANCHDFVRKELEIPESEVFWCAIAVGYPDKNAPVNDLKSTRLPLGDFAKFFGLPEEQQQIISKL